MRGTEANRMSGVPAASAIGPQHVSSSLLGGPPGHRSAGVHARVAGTAKLAAAAGLARTPLAGLTAPAGGVASVYSLRSPPGVWLVASSYSLKITLVGQKIGHVYDLNRSFP